MRIRKIEIANWRHFKNVSLEVADDASLVCIVGANGTGKSHILELISGCAHKLGLSQGINLPRGDPFADQHDFSLQFYLQEGASPAVDDLYKSDASVETWDRTLTISDRRSETASSRITAGGITNANNSTEFAQRVVNQLQQSKDVHFLTLDADRAYPQKAMNVHELAQAYETDWHGAEFTRGRSFMSTSTLYDEWIKYFLAQENSAGTRLMQDMRRAKEACSAPSPFEDHFQAYKDSLKKVLPHVVFSGVDPKKRTLLFDTTGLQLSFGQLSGGEREIAFLLGQIDRFGLREGLFLLDEPELHLNADLIRTWITYLIGTVSTGQIWLATHSLDAVEAAGPHATFVLERNLETRKVDQVARLDSLPVVSALSRAVGTPAFSITQLRFVFIEGEEGVGERDRFLKLTGQPEDTRFLECGSCNEVIRRVMAISSLAKESGNDIRIGGILDRDFRSAAEAADIAKLNGVYVLPVHEVENFFLHPKTLESLLRQNGNNVAIPNELIRETADKRAGNWIFQYAMYTNHAKNLPDMKPQVKIVAKGMSWEQIDGDADAASEKISKACGFPADDEKKFRDILQVAIKAYRRRRLEDTFWRDCEGKQVLNDIAVAIGFSGVAAMMRAAYALWERDSACVSVELAEFRSNVNGI
ncbi:recombination protein F [Stieleria neptunia]|uniref:Recombination protein F n=1 Tax=Stieleria neptunia TaxID=2527979 RepID=A0A518HYF0_9BACT|nr:AAA family ATPase [Stieleria neptunia]QDV45804.1 recombination protein F [Stieleria neptunia]